MSEWNARAGRYTAAKQRDFALVLGHLLPAIGAILRRHTWAHREVLYFDLTAGPGRYPELEVDGSPLTWIRAATPAGFASRAFFFEQDPATRAALEDYVATLPRALHAATAIIPGDHNATLPAVLHDLRFHADSRFGLAYADPNGGEIPVGALQWIGRQFPRVDLLTNVSATNYKRRLGAGVRTAYLADHITAMGKKVWLIREPLGQHQWTMLLGSNWPDLKAMKAAGFYRLESDEGQAILVRLNFRAADDAHGLGA